jgi:hypothetical protein
VRQKGFVLISILIVILIGVSGYFIYQNYQLKKQVTQPEPTTVVSPVATSSSAPSGNTQLLEGTITGKLCFPSSFIPKGSIEAKNIATGKIYTQDYPGTANGGATFYTINLPADKYFLRFKASQGTNLGYHTTVCPTGGEITCGDSEQRILISADVISSQTIKGYDLCDFYYSSQNTPNF